jgi:deuterolysin
MPAQNIIVDCPLYFSALPMVSGSCHGQDMSTTTVHESTHATYVYVLVFHSLLMR